MWPRPPTGEVDGRSVGPHAPGERELGEPARSHSRLDAIVLGMLGPHLGHDTREVTPTDAKG